MAKELHQSLEKLRGAADIVRALAVQMTELKLREAVQRSEEARLATQSRNQVFSRLVSSGLRYNSTRASSQSAHSKRHKENQNPPWQTFHAIPVAMKRRPAAASWRPE